LQPVDRWILAVLVVADRRRRHCLAHARRGRSYGVGTKVDAVHGGARLLRVVGADNGGMDIIVKIDDSTWPGTSSTLERGQ